MTTDPGGECVGKPRGLAQTIAAERCVRIADPADPDNDIVVWVAWARNGSARLVIDAPDHMRITRPGTDAGNSIRP